MASIRKRQLPSGKVVWQCDYKDQFGKRRARQFSRKREAEAHLSDAINNINKGTYVHGAGAQTLEHSLQEWLKTCRVRIDIGGQTNLERATYEDYRGKIENHLLHPEYGLGQTKVHLVNTALIDAFRTRMIQPGTRGRSAANAAKTIAVLRTYLGWAQDRGLITQNPLIGRKKRYSIRSEHRVIPPSHGLVARLVEYCPDNKRLYLSLAVLTGLRASEQRALHWRHIDLDHYALTVEQRLDRYQHIGPPKSRAGYRTIPLGPQLAQELDQYRQVQKAGIEDIVFQNAHGGYLRHDTEMKAWFEPLRNKVNAPHLRWHDLRHYAISCWIEAGHNPKRIQTRAGHSSIQITYDRYGHLLDKDHGDNQTAEIENRLYTKIKRNK